jgi:hypothetical protein
MARHKSAGAAMVGLLVLAALVAFENFRTLAAVNDAAGRLDYSHGTRAAAYELARQSTGATRQTEQAAQAFTALGTELAGIAAR